MLTILITGAAFVPAVLGMSLAIFGSENRA